MNYRYFIIDDIKYKKSPETKEQVNEYFDAILWWQYEENDQDIRGKGLWYHEWDDYDYYYPSERVRKIYSVLDELNCLKNTATFKSKTCNSF